MGSRRGVALVLALALMWPTSAGANSIEQIVPKDLTPAPGSTATFQIAVTPGDNMVWDAGSYTLTLIADDPNGTTLATAPPFTGEEPVTPQQTTMVFVDLTLPSGYTGPLNVHAHLEHGKTSEDSLPVGIVVGGAPGQAAVAPAALPSPGQIPAPGASAPSPSPEAPSPAPPAVVQAPPQNYNGSIALNAPSRPRCRSAVFPR